MFRVTKLDWTQQFYHNSRYSSAKFPNSKESAQPVAVKSARQKVKRGNVSEKDPVESALEHMIRSIEIFNKRFRFKIHRKTGEVVVQVIDSKTKKVVREIPPKEIVELHARLKELASEAGLKEEKEKFWG